MSKPAPGFQKHPDYQVQIEPSTSHVQARVGTTIVADTRGALKVTETRHRPVWYLPLADVEQTLLSRSATSTYCPFKGHASYWNITTPQLQLEDAVWSYEAPFAECEPLAGHVAFYPDKVALFVDGEPLESVAPGWTG